MMRKRRLCSVLPSNWRMGFFVPVATGIYRTVMHCKDVHRILPSISVLTLSTTHVPKFHVGNREGVNAKMYITYRPSKESFPVPDAQQLAKPQLVSCRSYKQSAHHG